jgi:hypothetical protein
VIRRGIRLVLWARPNDRRIGRHEEVQLLQRRRVELVHVQHVEALVLPLGDDLRCLGVAGAEAIDELDALRLRERAGKDGVEMLLPAAAHEQHIELVRSRGGGRAGQGLRSRTSQRGARGENHAPARRADAGFVSSRADRHLSLHGSAVSAASRH